MRLLFIIGIFFTVAHAVTIFYSDQLAFNGLRGSRAVTTAYCETRDSFEVLNCSSAVALLAYSAEDDFALFPSLYGIAINDSIVGPTGEALYADWTDFVNNEPPLNTYSVAKVTEFDYWLGRTSRFRCSLNGNAWTSNTNCQNGNVGKNDGSRVNTNKRCSGSNSVLCVCVGGNTTGTPGPTTLGPTRSPTQFPTAFPSNEPTTPQPSETPTSTPTFAAPTQNPTFVSSLFAVQINDGTDPGQDCLSPPPYTPGPEFGLVIELLDFNASSPEVCRETVSYLPYDGLHFPQLNIDLFQFITFDCNTGNVTYGNCVVPTLNTTMDEGSFCALWSGYLTTVCCPGAQKPICELTRNFTRGPTQSPIINPTNAPTFTPLPPPA